MTSPSNCPMCDEAPQQNGSICTECRDYCNNTDEAHESFEPDRLKGQVFLFLLNLRDSGVVNMFGASPYLEEHFDFDREEANEWLTKWMRSF